jgi:hypothetical protein
MNSTILFAKLQQNYIWKQKELKPKHRVTKMSEAEFEKAMEQVKSLTNGKVLDNTFSAGHKIDTVRVETHTFQFLYPYFSEEGLSLTNIRADKKYEGKICIFPSYLHHSVFPFYSSDKYRISIAGNLKVKNGD